MYFKRKELEKFRSFKGPLIDVRSPGEYYKGHLPNSINIPLFDNEERSIIGPLKLLNFSSSFLLKYMDSFYFFRLIF